jgi:hypothetical protein
MKIMPANYHINRLINKLISFHKNCFPVGVDAYKFSKISQNQRPQTVKMWYMDEPLSYNHTVRMPFKWQLLTETYSF